MQVWQRRSGGRISRRRLRLRRPCLPGPAAGGPAATMPSSGTAASWAGAPSAAAASAAAASSAVAGRRLGRRLDLGNLRLLRLGPHARGQLRRLVPGPGAGAVVGLARDLPILEIADLLRALLAVLRIRLADLSAHRPRQLAAALVEPGSLAGRAAAGALHVPQRGEDPRAALAHPVRRLGRGLAREAGIQLIAAHPGPGLLAPGGPATHLAIGDGAEVALALVAHPAGRIVR